MDLALAIGIGTGLASVAGVRAFLPLALFALVAHLGVFVSLNPYDLAAGRWWLVIGVLVGLAVVEIALDKVSSLERLFNTVMVPVRAVAGAVLFAGAMGFDLDTGSVPWLVIGAVIAGAVAVAKVVLRPSTNTASAGVSGHFLSLFEDLVGVVGGVLTLFVPYLTVLLVAFLLFFYYRVKRRRGRRFGGLRILGD
jgi:hypothetical protein